jgi:hypothetical protein
MARPSVFYYIDDSDMRQQYKEKALLLFRGNSSYAKEI